MEGSKFKHQQYKPVFLKGPMSCDNKFDIAYIIPMCIRLYEI